MNLDVFSGSNPFKKETRIAKPLVFGDRVSDIYFTIPLEDSEVDMTQNQFQRCLLNVSSNDRNIVFGLLYGLSFSVNLNNDNTYENLSFYKSVWDTQYRQLVLSSIGKLGLNLNQYSVLTIAENVFIAKNRISIKNIVRESIITLDKTVTDGKVWNKELTDRELSKVDYFTSWITDKLQSVDYRNQFPQMKDTFELLKNWYLLKEQLINWELDGHSFLNSKFSNDLLTLIRVSIYDLSLAEKPNEKIKLLNNPEGINYFHYLLTNIYLMTADMLTGRSYLMTLESKFKDIINVDQFWEKYIYLLFSECFVPEDKTISNNYLRLINLVGRMKWSKGELLDTTLDDSTILQIISDSKKKSSINKV